jgi:hypothetical protein
MSARDCNSPLHKQFMHCLEGVFDDNNEGIFVSFFARCESLLLIFTCGVCSGINRALAVVIVLKTIYEEAFRACLKFPLLSLDME